MAHNQHSESHNVFTFTNRPVNARTGSKAGSAQRNSSLITKLFLSLQYRPHADMEEFFRYENQREPPSLSNQGSLRSGNKSDIIECLKAPTGRAAEAKVATVVVLDMAAVVHMVRPTSAHTFRDYVSHTSGAICGVTSHSNCHTGCCCLGYLPRRQP